MSLKKYNFILPFFLILFGGIQSYRQAFISWYADPDSASIVLASKEVVAGWSEVKDFLFPIDNWLLSLILPDTLVFHFFGDSPSVLIKTGIAIFWLTAILTGMLVACLSDWKRGLWAMALVFCAPEPALGTGAYLTASVAHHVSIAWGLFGLIFLFLWFKRQSYIALLIAAAVFVITCFSDPWALPVFLLPILMTAVVLFCWHFQNPVLRLRALMAFLMGVGDLILCQTHILGLLPVKAVNPRLAHIHLSLQDWYKPFQYIPYFFHFLFYPCRTLPYDMDYWPTSVSFPKHLFVVWDSLFFLAALFILAVAYLKESKKFTFEVDFTFGILLFSAAGILSSAVLGQTLTEDHSGRYLINFYYIFIIFVCVVPHKNLSKFLSVSGGALFISWFLSGAISNFDAWKLSHSLKVRDETKTLVKVLKNNHINLAYGSYWLTKGNAVTWLTKEKLQVLPFNYYFQRHGFLPDMWTAPSWYQQDENKKWAFILTGEEWGCEPFFTCEEAAINEFGFPDEIKKEGGVKLMIYAKHPPVIEKKFDTLLELDNRPVPVDLGLVEPWKEIDFGWGKLEGRLSSLNEWRYWNESFHAFLRDSKTTFKLPENHGDKISVMLRMRSSTKMPKKISVFYKKKFIKELMLQERYLFYTLEVPVSSDQKLLTLTFKIGGNIPALEEQSIELAQALYLEKPLIEKLYE